MPNVQQWGRRESIIWPPRGYLYTLGACVGTGFFIYLRLIYGLSPLERYYLPYYLRSEMAGLAHPANAYRMLHITHGESQGRLALDADVQPGSMLQSDGAPLSLMLSPQAAQNGRYLIYRERLFKFVEGQNVELGFSERIAPAKGLSQGRKITLLSGMQPTEEFSTVVHEIARLWGAETYVELASGHA